MKNVFVFYGVDHKVGTTMVAQSTAQALAAADPAGGDVLFLALNPRKSAEYVREEPDGVDQLKCRLRSGLLTADDLKNQCAACGGIYVLGGIGKEEESRQYLPEDGMLFLQLASAAFSSVVVDAGNTLDNGLSTGALSAGGRRLLVLTQQETVLSRWEYRKSMYARLRLTPDLLIVNQFLDRDLYSLRFLSKRLQRDRQDLYSIRFVRYGRQAEIEQRTLFELAGDPFCKDVTRLAQNLTVSLREAEDADRRVGENRRKSWQNFISINS